MISLEQEGASAPSYPVPMDMVEMYPRLYIERGALAKLKAQPLTPGSMVSFGVLAMVVSSSVDDEGVPSSLTLCVCEMDRPKIEEEPEKVMYP